MLGSAFSESISHNIVREAMVMHEDAGAQFIPEQVTLRQISHNLNSFRWPNVFLMQPCDLCCCQSLGLIAMPGCWWAADRDQEKVAKIDHKQRRYTFDQIHID